MSKDSRYSLEEILEEQRRAREEHGTSEAPEEEAPGEEEAAEPEEAEGAGPEPEEEPEEAPAQENEDIQNGRDLGEEDGGEEDWDEDYPEDSGVVPSDAYEEDEEALSPREEKRRRKEAKKADKLRRKGQKKGFFERRRERKQAEEFDASEDMYYGIQLKPIDEYTRRFSSGEETMEQEGFRKLFDENTKELDEEVAANFDRLQRERRRRVAEAVENAGVDVGQIDEEFGIVAPIPVSAYAGDPYAKQHGLDSEKDLPEFQRAMLQEAETRTMEFKLDMESDSLGVQQTKVVPEVSEESVQRILEAVDPALETAEKEPPKLVTLAEDLPEGAAEETAPENVKESAPEDGAPEKSGEEQEPEETAGGNVTELFPNAGGAPADGGEAPEPVKYSVPVTDVTTYRPRDLTMHVIGADVLQSALLSEAEVYKDRAENGETAPRGKAKRDARLDDAFYGEEEPGEEAETLDDYTGPADAKSVSHDLRSRLNGVTLRVLVSGIGTLVLFIVTLFAESRFGPDAQAGDAVGYIVTSMILFLILLGFCWNTIVGGLRSLFAFLPNSDSAAAVSAVAVLIHTVCAFFFEGDLAKGDVHLLTSVAALALFCNAAGKLTLLRRIHANFRFVASRDAKYAVRIFDDHNTSLRLAGDSPAETPVIAYQQKADFLKRFLKISYAPDDAEAASQTLAPIGTLASLALCLAALLFTGDAGASLTALAAASCVCVCVTNLLAMNLPVSRQSRALRRAGAMVSGYEAARRISETNTVFVDSEQLFPRGSIVLNGIKAFKTEGLEEAVLNASVLVHALGGPIGGVFDQVLQEFESEDLPKVGSATYETGSGVVGRVGAHTVLIGNRQLLRSHNVEPPEEDVERKYLTGDRQLLYLAADGDLYALFSVTYNPDSRKAAELRTMQENGVTLLVRAADPNLTPEFLAKLFRLDVQSLRVLGAGEEPALDGMASGSAGRVDAYAATKGRLESMLRLIAASMDLRRQVGIIVALQVAAVIIGFALVALLTFLSGVPRLTAPALLGYEGFWILVIWGLPKLIASQTKQNK